MNSRERVGAAFDGLAVDKTPICHVSFSSRVAADVLGREAYVGFGIQQWREAKALWQGEDAHREFLERSYQDALELNRLTDQDLLRFSYGRHGVKPTKRLDEHTFLYEHGPEANWQILRHDPAQEHYSVVFPLHPPPRPTLDDLEPRVAAAEKALETYQPRVEDFSLQDFTIRAQRELGHETVIRVHGASINIPRDEAWLEATILRPDLIGRLLDVQVERALRGAVPLAQLGFRYLFGGGDFAGNSGPMYSPRVFHELMAPRLQRLSDGLHRLGLRWLFASDGDLWPVADDLFGRSGVDGFFEIDSDAGMDLPRLRARFPRLTLVGNLSSHLVHRGTKAEVVDAARRCLDEARALKGVIVGVTNMIMPGSPPENVMALLDTLRQYR